MTHGSVDNLWHPFYTCKALTLHSNLHFYTSQNQTTNLHWFPFYLNFFLLMTTKTNLLFVQSKAKQQQQHGSTQQYSTQFQVFPTLVHSTLGRTACPHIQFTLVCSMLLCASFLMPLQNEELHAQTKKKLETATRGSLMNSCQSHHKQMTGI